MAILAEKWRKKDILLTTYETRIEWHNWQNVADNQSNDQMMKSNQIKWSNDEIK